jgi:predicted secreted protein
VSTADPPARLALRPGDERRYVLPNHGGGGYRWRSRVEGDSVRVTLDYEAAPGVASSTRMAAQVLEIVAVRPGTATVLLSEGRSWEGEAAATDRRTVDVEVTPQDEEQSCQTPTA